MRLQLIALVLLVGCQTQDRTITKVETQEVKVPVPVRCKMHMPTKAGSEILGVTDPEDTYAIAQAALADLETERRFNDELVSGLSKCVDLE